jgi:alkanesulfonate monooxygenase SsuD/methylene tetrahydromethanopterin reductase-like flavin-dependent oxidoreductase (luciferase family)
VPNRDRTSERRARPLRSTIMNRVPAVLDVQLSQAALTWPELRDRALAVEAAGYETLWVFDHLAGQGFGGSSMLEAFTLLGALATTTTTVELGVMVANVNNRTPALLTVAAATVQAVADRRFHLGVGAGGSPRSRWSAEMRAVGQPVEPTRAGRHRLVEQTLDTIDRLWNADRSPTLATFPLPRPRPPVIVGVNGPQLAALAGRRADGVNVHWLHPRRDELLEVAASAAGTAGRTEFALTTYLRWEPALLDAGHPTRVEMAARDIARVVLVVPADVTADELGPDA